MKTSDLQICEALRARRRVRSGRGGGLRRGHAAQDRPCGADTVRRAAAGVPGAWRCRRRCRCVCKASAALRFDKDLEAKLAILGPGAADGGGGAHALASTALCILTRIWNGKHNDCCCDRQCVSSSGLLSPCDPRIELIDGVWQAQIRHSEIGTSHQIMELQADSVHMDHKTTCLGC